jgi:hypothetical protein
MYFCYLDESGTPEPAGTSHFVLVGLAIPSTVWKRLETSIEGMLMPFGLAGEEVHTAWVIRRIVEQEKVANFADLSPIDRKKQVQILRDQNLIRIAATGSKKKLKATKLNYRKTAAYLHLTMDERHEAIRRLADCVGNCVDARLFAQVVDKHHLATLAAQSLPPFEYAFTELVQRFEYFLRNRGRAVNQELHGLLVQDNNQTVALKLTNMMRQFHRQGTRWTAIQHIIETPFFVDSQLTSMVQMADLCGYAIRRYFENNETDLFDRIFSRFDRTPQGVVGIHHFSNPGCTCRVCKQI